MGQSSATGMKAAQSVSKLVDGYGYAESIRVHQIPS